MTCFYSEKNIVKVVENIFIFFIKIIRQILKLFNMKKVFIGLLTSFLLWMFISLFWVFLYLENIQKVWSENTTFFSEDLDLTSFWEVYELIEEEYFTTNVVKKEDLVNGAITWMVEALWDQHSEFMNPDMTEKFEASLNGDFEWIWAVVEKVPLWVKIERILSGSPAKKYGVRAWDIVISANGAALEDLDIFDAIDEIKWPAGTTVLLEIIRTWEDKILEIEVIRAKIQIPSVEEKFFEEENLGYIAINMFGESTAQEFRKALDNVKSSGVEGLVIDLRDNGGGYLQSAVEILSEFIPQWEVLVKTKYKDSFFNENYFSMNDGDVFDKKIVVLINGNSASASEITAGTLREYDKALLLWTQSYWKWSVQQPFDFEDGSLLKITVAKWFTPKWKNIELEWVSPDIEVDFLQEDYENNFDRQLEEAKKLLGIFISDWTIGLTLEEYKKNTSQEVAWNSWSLSE